MPIWAVRIGGAAAFLIGLRVVVIGTNAIDTTQFTARIVIHALSIQGNAKAIEAGGIGFALTGVLTWCERMTNAFNAKGVGAAFIIADTRLLAAAIHAFFPVIALGLARAITGV